MEEGGSHGKGGAFVGSNPEQGLPSSGGRSLSVTPLCNENTGPDLTMGDNGQGHPRSAVLGTLPRWNNVHRVLFWLERI